MALALIEDVSPPDTQASLSLCHFTPGIEIQYASHERNKYHAFEFFESDERFIRAN